MRRLLEELFSAYYKDVYHYLYSLSRDASLSEDLAQEVFTDVITSAASFRGDSEVKTWLFAIARNKWYSWLRRKNRQPETEMLTEFLESSDQTPEDHYQMKELAERIHQMLEQEPERTQKIVLLRLKGLSFFEIGKETGVSENSARVIDFRTKTKIRQILKKEGYICE